MLITSDLTTPLNAKLRLSDPVNWLRLRLDVCNLVTELRGLDFVRSRKRMGEQFMLLVVRAMSFLHTTTLSYIFTCVSNYLYRKLDIDILSTEITVRLPRHDLYFVCCALDRDMSAFLDGLEFLELEVTTTRPLNPVRPNAEESLSRLSHIVQPMAVGKYPRGPHWLFFLVSSDLPFYGARSSSKWCLKRAKK